MSKWQQEEDDETQRVHGDQPGSGPGELVGVAPRTPDESTHCSQVERPEGKTPSRKQEAVEADLETLPSRELCERISKESDGVTFLGFSRGKDSIAAWIYLKRFFKRIIPFHCASVPHLKFVDDSLEYYEDFFATKVHRFLDGACS